MQNQQKPKSVSFITADETLDLRSRVLRPGQPLEACIYPEDKLGSTFHLGIIVDGKVISNGTFMQQSHLSFREANRPYRLRGMATDHHWQKQGCGKLILQQALQELRKRHCDLLWFNARLTAEAFYAVQGFSSLETVFDIPTIGAHRVMFKKI
jgi:GNAT superfamily N-acetyltransferase